jgi:hypothetical protein
MRKLKAALTGFILRPGVTNGALWYPRRLPETTWRKIRRLVLERDNHTCVSCGHRALKWMNIHHVEESENNNLENLQTLCVACHAVLHVGLNLSLGKIEIWKTDIPQVEIVRKTRKGILAGKSLAEIKKSLKLKRGPLSPKSVNYATNLIRSMGRKPRAYLPEPLCAVFVGLMRWQLG